MSTGWESVYEFLEGQVFGAARRFPIAPVPKMLGFMGTTCTHGQHAAVSVHQLLRLERAAETHENLHIVMRGHLARPPAKGESVTVALTDLSRFRGFQVRTLTAGEQGGVKRLVETGENAEICVHGKYVYTLHNSPNSVSVFEDIPWDEVREMERGDPYVLAAVGERANLSPRFVFHFEVAPDSLTMFHGEGYTNKTYLNIQKNNLETRVFVDPESFKGFCFYGATEAVSSEDESVGVRKVREGFEAGGWGIPQRIYRFATTRWLALSPDLQAV